MNVKSKLSEPICVSKSKFGKGVFAVKNIHRGERICIMKGKRIQSKDFSRETQRGRNTLADPFQIGIDQYLLLDEPYLFINHSCDPNAGLKNNIDLIAIRKIRQGEEILYDYSTVWFEGFACKCGSPKCRKNVSEFYTIPDPIRKRYKKLGIIPSFIK